MTTKFETEKALSVRRLVASYEMPAQGEMAWLCEMLGIVTHVRITQTDRGEAVRYTGDFVGRSLRATDAQPVRSAVLYAPQCDDMLAEAGIDSELDGFFAIGVRIGVMLDPRGRPKLVGDLLFAPQASSPAEALIRQHRPAWLGETGAPVSKPKAK